MDERKLASLMAMVVMFEQEGWQELMRELAEELDYIRITAIKTKSTDDVLRLQGRAEQIEGMLFLQATVEAMLSNEEAQDATV